MFVCSFVSFCGWIDLINSYFDAVAVPLVLCMASIKGSLLTVACPLGLLGILRVWCMADVPWLTSLALPAVWGTNGGRNLNICVESLLHDDKEFAGDRSQQVLSL